MSTRLCIIFITFCFCSCMKDILPEEKVEDKIIIIGTITDTENNPLDFVKVIIKENTFMSYSIPISNTYSNNLGRFELEFFPKKGHVYNFNFEKSGYDLEGYYEIKNDKQYQKYEIKMKKTSAR